MSDNQFARARTAEQREQRRMLILEVTRNLLREQRVKDVSLNEIARRVGLAKSNVLRYFGSRESILLTLLGEEYRSWVDDIEESLRASYWEVSTLAQLLASTAVRRPLMCELLSCTNTVLEYNVAVEEVIAFKVDMYAQMGRLIAALQAALQPRVLTDSATTLVALHAAIAESWSIAHPAPALIAAARQDARIFPPPQDAEKLMTDTIALTLRGSMN